MSKEKQVRIIKGTEYTEEFDHSKLTLRERILDSYCKWCPREQECDEDLTLEEKRGCLACGGFADDWVNLLKEALEGLTVMADEGINQFCIENGFEDVAVEGRTMELCKGLISHTIKELKEKMG